MFKEDIENAITAAEDHFSGHIAKFERMTASDNPNHKIEVLEWARDEDIHDGYNFYRIRYVFDKFAGRIYITGDLGSAVLVPTWAATLEDTITFLGDNMDKIKAFYDSNECTTEFGAYNARRFLESFKSRFGDFCEKLNIDIPSRTLVKYWRSFGFDLAMFIRDEPKVYFALCEQFGNGEGLHDIITEMEDDAFEMPRPVYFWVIGLQMAWKQIQEND